MSWEFIPSVKVFDERFVNISMYLFEICFSAGHPPFLAENYDQLKEKIINQDFPAPKARGYCVFIR